jgi:cytochrome-b5 reductase
MADSNSLLARKYVDGIYIPLGLLVVGTAIVKREWTPYALVLGIILGAIKYIRNRTSSPIHHAAAVPNRQL